MQKAKREMQGESEAKENGTKKTCECHYKSAEDGALLALARALLEEYATHAFHVATTFGCRTLTLRVAHITPLAAPL